MLPQWVLNQVDLWFQVQQVSVERSMLDLESEVQWFNTH